MNIVINAMQECWYEPHQEVIKQGDNGDILFVVESGALDCTKIFPGNTSPTFLKTYVPGEAFGELALLYNAPWAATIVAKEPSLLWGLDRNTFNHIVKDSAMRNRQMYEEFLKKVPLLSSMDSYEWLAIADAFVKSTFKKGEKVITEGEEGNVLFFLYEGTAEAIKKIDGHEQVVMSYKEGDYFGEWALLKWEPWAATIVATSDELKVVSIEWDAFKRLLGPLEDILKRNMEIYAKFK